jgi:translocation and assembly module TamA
MEWETETPEVPEFGRIDVNGNVQEMVDVATILTKAESISCDDSKAAVSNAMEDLALRVKETARAYGYYDVDVAHGFEREQVCWLANIVLDIGERTTVDRVNINIVGEAMTDEGFIKGYRKNIPVVGEGLLHSQYEMLKTSIQQTAARRGYFDGVFVKNELKVDQQNSKADITLSFESGVRYRIGEIRIEQDVLEQRLFGKYLSVNSGDYFDDINLVTSYQTLSGTEYFSVIEVSPVLDEKADGVVPIRVKAEKGKTINYSVGVGVATDTGPRIKFYYRNKLANRRGHSHRTDLSLSPVISSLRFSYRLPDKKAKTDYYEFSTSATHEDTDTSVSDTFLTGIARTNQLKNDWLRTYGLQYSIDQFEIGQTEDRTALLRPVLGFSKISTDSPLRVLRGYRVNMQVTGASKDVFSDINMAQISAGGKYVYGLGDRFRMLGRLDLGYTLVDEFERLPSSLRFFAGGDTSIRGYRYEELGPENDEGEVIGGEELIVLSFEIDYEFKPGWSMAGFADTGNAFNNADLELKTGAGFGVRWQSPIGPIRLDLGFPINDDDARQSYRIHFTLGPDL